MANYKRGLLMLSNGGVPPQKPTGLLGLAQGPFGPMGGGVNIGEPIDMSRPKIQNADGSFSTERTITLQAPDGYWYNVPSIVGGKQLPEHQIESLFLSGQIPYVGRFQTLDQSERSARVRTQQIGKVRR